VAQYYDRWFWAATFWQTGRTRCPTFLRWSLKSPSGTLRYLQYAHPFKRGERSVRGLHMFVTDAVMRERTEDPNGTAIYKSVEKINGREVVRYTDQRP
jgi:hypothetical protein